MEEAEKFIKEHSTVVVTDNDGNKSVQPPRLYLLKKANDSSREQPAAISRNPQRIACSR
jgi:hypothetical protein